MCAADNGSTIINFEGSYILVVLSGKLSLCAKNNRTNTKTNIVFLTLRWGRVF